MKSIVILLISVMILGLTSLNAQDKNKQPLLDGKWKAEMKGQDFSSVYKFKEENGKLVGYSVKIVEKNGVSHNDNSKVLVDVDFDGKSGKAKYKFKWEGESYEVNCKLKLVKPDTLEVSYNYGEEFKEVWTKLKK